MGMRKAKSASDGNKLTNWKRVFIFYLCHPGAGDGLHGLKGPDPIVKGSEIHIIHSQGNHRKTLVGIGDPHHRTLAVNTFLTETVIGR